MKKISYLLIVGLIMVLSQNVKAGDKDYGIRAGWQSALLTIDGDNTDALSSYYIGLFKESQILPLIKYGYGLEYAQMGGKELVEYKLGYVGVPLYLKAKIGPVYGLLGSGVNFKISETDILDAEKAKAIDVPAYAGVGFSILMLSLEARYHWGLMEIQEKTKNQYLQIGLAVSF